MNVGLLTIKGGTKDGDELNESICINMVVNVSADKSTGGLKKLVINPLDE